MSSPTLVVEDGSGLAAADSLASVEDADTYAALYGNEGWSALTYKEKEIALRIGTQFIAGSYDGQWKGTRTFEEQNLPWPRSGVIDGDGIELDDETIPNSVKNAVIEAAMRHGANPGSLVPDLTRGGKISSVSAGSVSVTYEEGASPSPIYPVIDRLLGVFLKGGTAGSFSVQFLNRA
jgi:hypothetical protein